MPKNGQDLLHSAMRNIRALGYRAEFPLAPNRFGKNVLRVAKGDDEEFALVQSRSTKDDDDDERYLVGIMISDLEKVDTFILWLEGEEHLFKIPANVLVNLFAAVKLPATQGIAARTTVNGE